MDDLIVGELIIPGGELVERFTTSGGPGGQHANRNETAVSLRWSIVDSTVPDEIRLKLIDRLGNQIEVGASDQRSQSRNRAVARDRMKGRIEAALQDPKARKATKPSRASREKRLSDKRSQSQKKQGRRPPDIDD